MRTPLALLLGSLLVSCTIGDSGTGTGGDDEGGATCGDGVQQAGEACDDGNNAGGDGCSATCTVEATPRLDMVVDKPTVSTELNTKTMLTVSLIGSGGFSGQVSLAGSVVDANNAPIPGWTVELNSATVNVPDGGEATAVATLTVPSENRGLAGTVKIDATSSLGAKSTTTAVTVANQISFEVKLSGNGNCEYTMGVPRVTVGTKVRMVNRLPDPVIFHSDGANRGVPHQDTGGGGTAKDGAYETTINSAGNAFGWYCHSPGPNPNGQQVVVGILPVAAQ